MGAPVRTSERRDPDVINPWLTGFSCIRCQMELPVGDYPEGCPICLSRGTPASVRPVYGRLPDVVGNPQKRGMARYADWLPYRQWTSLGEGSTSCISAQPLADHMGMAGIFIKNEGQNPSGSHKDRVSGLTVTRACDVGARGIVAASSGNAGASLALYAAAPGLRCSIVATPALQPLHRRAITATGARLITAGDSLERWKTVERMAREGWFPATNYLAPPVGSNAFGVEGLKTLAFELFEDLGAERLDAIFVPTSRGDLLWGLFQGFHQLREAGFIATLPRLFAIEPFPRISRILAGESLDGSYPGSTSLYSIAGSTVTYQAVEAIRRSHGDAVTVVDADVHRDFELLAQYGFYLELSSAATLTGLRTLIEHGAIARESCAVLIATSHGYKDQIVDGAAR